MTPEIDYTIFYKENLSIADDWNITWDLFISAYNSSERVRRCFTKATAATKHWLMLPEYQYEAHEFPTDGDTFSFTENNEAELVQHYFHDTSIPVTGTRICIDTTGFMRPQLIYLVRFLMDAGID